MNTEYKVTKSEIECIKIVGKNGEFGTISLDHHGHQGRISISSNYGNWSNYWGACGVPFKDFLIGLDKHYAANKFGADGYFDLEKTIQALDTRIKNYASDKSEKKELQAELKTLKESSCKEEFVCKMWHCDKILEMECHSPDLVRTISPSFNQFWEKIWPVFINELKQEPLNQKPETL